MNETLNTLQEELASLTNLQQELTTRKPENLAKYFITYTKLNIFSMHVMEEAKIKSFFKYYPEAEIQIHLFHLLRILKDKNQIEAIEELQRCMQNHHNPLETIKDIKTTIQIALEVGHLKNKEINKAIIYFACFLSNTKKEMFFPKAILRFIKQEDTDFFDCYINFLEYHYGLSTKEKFMKPISKRIDFLNREINRLQKEKRKKEQNQKAIQRKISQNPQRFYYVNQLDKSLWDNEETKEYYFQLLLNQNEAVLKQLKLELETQKEKWNDEWINIFLDEGFNGTLLSDEQMTKIKNSVTMSNLKQILKMLKEPIFQFINVTHPLFVNIITETSKEVLLSILKEIEVNNLTLEYIKTYPEILYAPYFRIYQINKETITKKQWPMSFFLNNNLLLRIPKIFEKIISLINQYDSLNVPYKNDSYFELLDEKLEQREDFLTYQEFPTYLPKELNEALENSSTIDIEDVNELAEIIFLDTNFKIDNLRYKIGNHIISRNKVLRIYTSLNSINENKEENITYAILYHCMLFEFEVEEIKSILKSQKRLLIP